MCIAERSEHGNATFIVVAGRCAVCGRAASV